MSFDLSPARFATLLALISCASFANAQTKPLTSREVARTHDTGFVENTTNREAIVASFIVEVDEAPWLRLAFDEVSLAGDALAGTGTKLRIVSLYDGAQQDLDALALERWRNTSAYFNGDSLLVELVSPPHSGPSRIVVRGVTAGLPPPLSMSICDTVDDRLPSTDPRGARVVPIGCSVWMIDDCANCFLTAGHCAGSSLQVVQFNVPPSTSGGSLQHPPPSDQYPVDPVSLQTNGGQGVGSDWAYFGVFANTTTGLTPFQAQGAAYTLAPPPPFDPAAQIRITGYGTDDTPLTRNQVQQTHTGLWTVSSGTQLSYRADTTGGNSGSPVIHEASGLAIGIHTHGGCGSGSGSNNGTASTHAALQAALASPLGVCGSGLSPASTLPSIVTPGVPTPVRVRVTNAIVPGSTQLHSRNGAGAFTAQPMVDVGGGVFEALLPAFECGAAPQYFFSTQTVACGTMTSPAGAPAAWHSAEVASTQVIFADDFQTNQGWVVSNGAGLTSGTWQRGVPVNADRGDPTSDGDGSGACYVTQNGAGDTDVDGGTTFLTSPVMNLTGGARISWRRWLGSTASLGAEDAMRVEVATDAAGSVWQVVRIYTTSTNSWLSDSIQAGFDVPATATVRVRFSVSDLSPGHVVEGGVDGFLAARVSCGVAGAVFCSGDGSATVCPCANSGAAGRGCAHSQNALGARLRAYGAPSTSQNSLTLAVDGLPASASTLVFQGDAQIAGGVGVVFGDGLRCASGTVVRLRTRSASGGAVALGAGVLGDPAVSAMGSVPAGGATRHYQAWYRNPAPFCTSSVFNLTNGLTLVWTP